MVIRYGLTVKFGEKVFPLAVAVSISFICFTVFCDRKYIAAVIISISIKTVKIFGKNCAPYLCIVLIGLQTAENLPPDSALKERCSIEKRMAELSGKVRKLFDGHAYGVIDDRNYEMLMKGIQAEQ